MEELRSGPDLEWGHPILNPEGIEIRVPQWVFPMLRSLGLLTRHPVSYRVQISPDYYLMTDLVAAPTFYHRQLRASDPSIVRGTPKGSGRPSKLLTALGPDCKGQPVVECECARCVKLKEEADHTRRPWRDNVPEKITR